jgi:hypothetical protein
MISYGRSGWKQAYYQCDSQTSAMNPGTFPRCPAKHVNAEWLEAIIWQHCRTFILDPGDALAEAQQELRTRLNQVTHLAED